jgi:ubiquinone/menaquinone biosynthesis C-methylase UbiE
MIAVGRAKALGNVDLVINGDAESLPFPECSFDSVVSCYVAKYVDPRKFAGELLRVLRVGGTVALYDFAKPKGALAPFLGLYIQGGLRGLGFLLRLARRSSAFTYSNLPRIIEESEWEGKMVETMEGVGFQTLAAERLTGVVFAYSGRKSPSN